ncbi:MAG: CsiV family protein [Pseudomonadota bacterium]
MRPDRLFGALLWLGVTAAVAQEPAATEDRFQVEVVVFSHTGPKMAHFRPTNEPDIGGSLRLDELAEPTEEFLASPQIVMELPFEPVEPQRLASVASRLERLGRYRVEAVRAWRQPAEVFGDAQRVRIRGDDPLRPLPAAQPTLGIATPTVEREPDWRVDGSMSFERGRFPHIRVDLVFRRPLREGAEAVPYAADAMDDHHSYRLRQRQQIRLGEPQYFDHPQFGVIAIVTEVTPET